MADDLPNEFDVIVVGTGMPESILAAALSRVGQSVLHVDRNDYYSGKWASFNMDGIEKWKEHFSNPAIPPPPSTPDVELKDGEKLIAIPQKDLSFSHLSSQYHVIGTTTQDIEEKPDPDKGQQDVNSSPDLQNQAVSQGHKEVTENKDCQGHSENTPEDVQCTKSEVIVQGKDLSSAEDEIKPATEPQKPKWTQEYMKKEWRRFNIDIAPKLLYCAGEMVQLLISSDVAKYCEFRTVTQMLTILEDKLHKVPCSRSDVFSSKKVSMIEKRILMKLLTFCAEFEKHPEEYKDFENKTFKEFLDSRRLSKTIKHFVQYSIAMTTESTPTLEGLEKTKKFLHSLGRYGNTAYLWSLYGSGELPQSFCRLSAVFGGIYCLKISPTHIIINQENKCTGVVLSSGQKISCKWLVMESSYSPEAFVGTQQKRSLSRGVLVVNSPLMAEQQLSLMSIEDPLDGDRPCTVLELPASSMACPPGLCMIHLTRRNTTNLEPEEDLSYFIDKLFATQPNDDGKPVILWSLFFCQQCDESTADSKLQDNAAPVNTTPDNVVILNGPGQEIDLDGVVLQIRDVFQKILPGEEFLPRPPHPDDIIYVNEAETAVNAEKSTSEYGNTETGDDNTINTSEEQGETITDTSSEQKQGGTNVNTSSELKQGETKIDASNELKQGEKITDTSSEQNKGDTNNDTSSEEKQEETNNGSENKKENMDDTPNET